LPHQVAFQRGTGSEARFQRGHFLGCFVFAGLNETGGAGEFAEVIFPILGSGDFLIIAFGGRSFRACFHALGRSFLLGRFFQEGIFQKLALHRLHKFDPGELEQANGLLQLWRHHKLL